MSTLVLEVIYEFFTYNKVLHSPKSTKFQDAIQEEYNTFVKNYTLDTIFVSDNQKVLKVKWLYKLKMSNQCTISSYKVRWVAKRFEQQESIDYAKIFSFIAQSCSIMILFTLAAYYGQCIEYLNAITVYINSGIDVLLMSSFQTDTKNKEKPHY